VLSVYVAVKAWVRGGLGSVGREEAGGGSSSGIGMRGVCDAAPGHCASVAGGE
jgi:hypothetical protein